MRCTCCGREFEGDRRITCHRAPRDCTIVARFSKLEKGYAMGSAIAFLGLCDRASHTRLGGTHFKSLNLVGLSNVILSPVYPTHMPKKFVVLAIENPQSASSTSIRLIDEEGKQVASILMTPHITEASARPTAQEMVDALGSSAVAGGESGSSWAVCPIPLKEVGIAFGKPGEYRLVASQGEEETSIGTLVCVHLEALPLTPERIAAIRSDPQALKVVRIDSRCNRCKEEFHAYASIEKEKQLEEQGYVRNTDLGARWRCKCGAADWDLRYIRTGLHGCLGATALGHDEELDPTRLYERSAVVEVHRTFRILLDARPAEDQVHVFIRKNRLLLQRFAPQLVYDKKSIMGQFNVDTSYAAFLA